MQRQQSFSQLFARATPIMLVLAVLGACFEGWSGPAEAASRREQLIPILGTTMENGHMGGAVIPLVVLFEERADRTGLEMVFRSGPGTFSPMSQTAVTQAIGQAARAAGLSTDSWSVILGVPFPGLTIYGNSLSAMVALSVLALAKGDDVPVDRVLTGVVTPDGRIDPVGAVPLKVAAADQAQMRRIVIPDEPDPADADWQTPFLGQVSPVGSLSDAYFALTDHPLQPKHVSP